MRSQNLPAEYCELHRLGILNTVVMSGRDVRALRASVWNNSIYETQWSGWANCSWYQQLFGRNLPFVNYILGSGLFPVLFNIVSYPGYLLGEFCNWDISRERIILFHSVDGRNVFVPLIVRLLVNTHAYFSTSQLYTGCSTGFSANNFQAYVRKFW